jgi:hypothetical protein
MLADTARMVVDGKEGNGSGTVAGGEPWHRSAVGKMVEHLDLQVLQFLHRACLLERNESKRKLKKARMNAASKATSRKPKRNNTSASNITDS